MAEKTRRAVANLAIPHSSSTLRPTTKHSIENLIQMADQALYSAKEMGRNNAQSHDALN
ncbi:MAG: GGDEF domain-containing protein [Proteobacteria bacterium]|nr:GGDEF domain-containing protein [Pseudomonadota bacterium]